MADEFERSLLGWGEVEQLALWEDVCAGCNLVKNCQLDCDQCGNAGTYRPEVPVV